MLSRLLYWPLEYGALLVAIALFVGSVILYRHIRGWQATLQLVGAGAWLGYNTLWSFLSFMATYALIHPDSSFARFFFPTDTEDPVFDRIALALRVVAICFPIGFILSMRRISKHLTNHSSEPPTSERISE